MFHIKPGMTFEEFQAIIDLMTDWANGAIELVPDENGVYSVRRLDPDDDEEPIPDGYPPDNIVSVPSSGGEMI